MRRSPTVLTPKMAHANGATQCEQAIRLEFVDGDEFDRIVRSETMIAPR